MKKLLMTLTFLLAINPVYAAGPNAIVHTDFCSDLAPAYRCPALSMWNRTNTKMLAIYTPNQPPSGCDTGSMKQWRMGHPNNAYGVGFTAEDWQDLEVAKTKTKGNYRWGCCFSSQPYNAICLY